MTVVLIVLYPLSRLPTYREIDRLSSKYVQRILNGASPKDINIETPDSVELAINLQTAKRLGVTIPPQLRARQRK